MERYQVILAYDGTRYKGFQRQSGAEDKQTIQGVVETTLRRLGWQGDRILASGRTDSGVHAAGQVIAFDLEWKRSPEELQAALNALFPKDIAALTLKLAPSSFHPRYDANSRTYRYRLYCHPIRHPLIERYAWRVWPELDDELLLASATLLVGKHDFSGFGTNSKSGSSAIREVLAAKWVLKSLDYEMDGWEFIVTANGFLYRMVRRLVNFQVLIAQGQRSLTDLQMLIDNPPNHPVPGLAPSQGLILQEVCYS